MKEKGILLPIYSLPSKYGIGDFGNEAYERNKDKISKKLLRFTKEGKELIAYE